ncbi:SNF2-related protein [Rugamonas sp. A1-17]|nr:SNF2-related protein [Rugamonas sp. A1-17]
MQTPWYEPLRNIISLGSQKQRISNMGELAAQRRQHLGQFFTPDHVAAFMWRIVAGCKFNSIFDNSIGSARLVQYADPAKHSIYGVDVHDGTVSQVKAVIHEAGFTCDILHAGMEEIHPKGMDLSLINPPFSIHLESALMKPFRGITRMGRFGPDSSAISEEYSLIQALEASKVVVALLPSTTAEYFTNFDGWNVKQRLRAVFHLPRTTFEDENANVSTSIVVFGDYKHAFKVHVETIVDWEQQIPDLKLAEAFKDRYEKPALRHKKLDASEPTITLPVTGDNRVHVALDGRRIKLKYFCGFTQARVANAVLVKRIFTSDHNRLPAGVKYGGEGALDLEVHLMQHDPLASFEELLKKISDNGGTPVVPDMVRAAIERRHKESMRQSMPLSHTIWSRGAGQTDVLNGTAKKSHNVDPAKWVSPVIKQGELVEFRKNAAGTFSYTKAGKTYDITADDLEEKFTLDGVSEGWIEVHSGLRKAYPQHAAMLAKRAKTLGMTDWLTWDFQLDDAIELTMKPRGAIGAWKQGTGKSRLAAALLQLSGMKHGLMVLESRLIAEMVDQLNKVDISTAEINIIDEPEKLYTLKRINLISYERLRMPVGDKPKDTYAKRLRRRIGILVADEGEKLSNTESDQTRAVWQVSAKKRYILTGTPIANYPRDSHGLMLFVGGDATAAQPYGYRRGHLEQNWISTMQYAKRGLDGIRDNFTVFDWVSHEFADSLREGAKREIPKIANVEKFRAWLAPLVKRRLIEEPAVAKHIKMPAVLEETIELGWEKQHLGLYLKTADDFADWYRNNDGERGNNLAVLLAKLQAVHKALNCPQECDGDHRGYTGLTTKQEAVLQKLEKIAENGEKSILFAENPATVKLLHRELKKRGVGSIPFHGGITIKKRVEEKNERFRNGDVPHLLATKATAKSGYNEPQADYVLFYDQSWSHRIMNQAMCRPLRPERTKPLKVLHYIVEGSLDAYQAQMVAFKKDSADAGLDWATPELDGVEYLHMGTILQRFVDDLAKIKGVRSCDLRKYLKEAA